MSWFRIEGRMPQHRKVAPLSDAAFRLHITSGAWSCDEGTDGLIPGPVVPTLTAAPRGKRLIDAIQELLDAGVWDLRDNVYQIHDYLDWNISAAELAKRRADKVSAGQAGGKRSGEQRRSRTEAAASALLKQTRSKTQALSDPDPGSDPKEIKDQDHAREDAPPRSVGNSDPCMNPEETVIPLTLRERATDPGGAIDQLTAHLKLPKAVLLDYLDRKYLPYWTIGKGMGERRSYWLKHLRQQILEASDRGHLKAIGLVEHEQNTEAKARRNRPKTVAEMEQEALDARS